MATDRTSIRDSLHTLQDVELDLERWLETEGVARFDAHHADPSRELSGDRFLNELQRHLRTSKATD